MDFLFFLSWEFLTEKDDIGFGVYRKETSPDGKSKLVEVIATSRFSCHMVPESGVMECDQVGTCEYPYKMSNK